MSRRACVLAVDDDLHITEFLHEVFRFQEDLCLLVASDVQSARRVLQEYPADLILLDIDLPDGNGLRLCSELRDHQRWGNIPIVFLTGETGLASRTSGLVRGGNGYLTKPFDPKVLLERIRDVLQKTGKA